MNNILDEIKSLKTKLWFTAITALVFFAFLCGSLYVVKILSKQVDLATKSLSDLTKTNQVLKKLLRDNNISMLEIKEKPLQIEDGTFEDTINRYLDGTYLLGDNCPRGVTYSINAGSCVEFDNLSAKEYDSGFQLDISISKVIDSESIEDYCLDKANIKFISEDRLIDRKYALLGCEDKVLTEAIKNTGKYRVSSFGDAYKKYKLYGVN